MPPLQHRIFQQLAKVNELRESCDRYREQIEDITERLSPLPPRAGAGLVSTRNKLRKKLEVASRRILNERDKLAEMQQKLGAQLAQEELRRNQ
jgi:hypothetical protein